MKKDVLSFSIALIFLMVADIATTYFAITKGYGYEGNGAMKNVVENIDLFILVKLLGSSVIIFCSSWCFSKNPKIASYGMRTIIFFMLLVVGNNLFVISANAESGTLSIDSITTKSNYYFTTPDGVNIKISMDYLFFDKADYNIFYGYQIRSSDNFAITQDKSSTWFIVSGGSGTGVVITNISRQYIAWTCDSACVITDTNVSFSYANPGWKTAITSFVANNTISIPGVGERSTENASVNKPVCLPAKYSDGVPRCWQRTAVGTYSGSDSSVGVNTQVAYDISYIAVGGVQWFNTSFGKPAAPNTQVFVNTSTGSLYQSALNNANVSVLNPYGSGIILRANTATATSGNVTVNSSGCSSCVAPTPVPTPVIDPNTGAGILWEQTTYNLGETGRFSWVVDVSFVDWLLSSHYIEVGQNGAYPEYTYISDNGNYSIVLDKPGVWTANLRKQGILEGHSTSNTILATDSTNVAPDSPSWILFNSTQYMRVAFNATYHIGYSLVGYLPTDIQILVSNNNDGNLADVVFQSSLSNDGQVILQQNNTKAYPAGLYTVKLFDSRKNKVLDSKQLTIVQDPSQIPVLGINISNISSNKYFYNIGDIATFSFIVDDANFTNYSIRGEIRNTNLSTTTKYFYTSFTSQIGQFDDLVNAKDNMKCDRGLYCWYEPGFNTISLVRYNSTESLEIASQVIFVSQTTVDGWGLSLSSNNISTTDVLTMHVIVPDLHTGILRIRDAGYSPNATEIYRTQVSPGSQNYQTSISRVNINGVGYYEVELIDENGVVKMHIPLTVNKATTPASGQGTNPNEPIGSDNVINLLSNNTFWALILTVGIMLAVGAGASRDTKDNSAPVVPMVVSGFLSLSVTTILGWMPVWIVFGAVIIAIVAFAWNYAKNANVGSQ